MKNGLCANELIKALCDAFGPSGCEGEVAALICSQIDGLCDSYEVDRLGNIVARMRTGTGEARAKLMLCAHMDEVGFMVTGISADGYLRFANLGGISPSVLCGRHVVLGDERNRIPGVICSKAIHHKKKEEREKITPVDKMYIDIGVDSREEALKFLDIGAFGTFSPNYTRFGAGECMIKSKAVDDRLGCALLIEVMRAIKADGAADFPALELYFCFTVREEIGISGAQVAAQTIRPDFAVVLETTAVADIDGVAESSRVAKLGDGGVISLMDRSTVYDREFVDFALDVAAKSGIAAQVKKYVSGGNDASHIHKSGTGVRTLALSIPTRYLHSPSCVCRYDDYESSKALVCRMISEWRL